MKNNDKGLEPSDIAKLVSHVLKTKKPKLSYNIGKDSIFARLMSFLPQRFVNFAVKKGLQCKLK